MRDGIHAFVAAMVGDGNRAKRPEGGNLVGVKPCGAHQTGYGDNWERFGHDTVASLHERQKLRDLINLLHCESIDFQPSITMFRGERVRSQTFDRLFANPRTSSYVRFGAAEAPRSPFLRLHD